MTKGIFAGTTDYSHQSFDDIVNDLESELKNVAVFVEKIQNNIDKLKLNDYWSGSVPFNFSSIVAYAIKHFNTTETEFQDIIQGIKRDVKKHHCKRLQTIAEVASEINIKIGLIWHRQYDKKDYENANFMIVESIYRDTRDVAVDLLDISNLAARLTDFIGKSNKAMTKKNKKESKIFKYGAYAAIFVAVLTGLTYLGFSVDNIFGKKDLNKSYTVKSTNQQGGITVGKIDNLNVNQKIDIPPPEFNGKYLTQNIPEGNIFKTEILLIISSPVQLNKLSIEVFTESVISIEARQTGMISRMNNVLGRSKQGYAIISFSNAYGEYSLTITTKEKEDDLINKLKISYL